MFLLCGTWNVSLAVKDTEWLLLSCTSDTTVLWRSQFKNHHQNGLIYSVLSRCVAFQLPSHRAVSRCQRAPRAALLRCGCAVQLQQSVRGALQSSELREALPGAAGPGRRFHSQHQIQRSAAHHHGECDLCDLCDLSLICLQDHRRRRGHGMEPNKYIS